MNFSSPQTRRNNPKAIRRIANAAPNCRLWRGSNDAVAVWLIGISPSFLTLPVPVSLHRGVNAQFDNRAAWIIGGELHIPCDREIGRASCRERGCQYVSIPVVAVSLKKKTGINRKTNCKNKLTKNDHANLR